MIKKILQRICGYFYHRIGMHDSKCIRCGITFEEYLKHPEDGAYISTEYDVERKTK